MLDARLHDIRRALRHHDAPEPVIPAGHVSAAVALVVRPGIDDLEVLLIRRAEFAGDPWSGHMAFPGGRRDARDVSLHATAVREACEEVGVDLERAATFLGALDSVNPRAGAPQVVVTPFAFGVARDTKLAPNTEVAAVYWMPIRALTESSSRHTYEYTLPNGATMHFPAILYDGCVIWGLTYRILGQFLELTRAGVLPESVE
jgi:8-oxo-dGTP pyrophosphatase MutT (NUDIX family)